MTRDEIIRMAKEAGWQNTAILQADLRALERFAALVAAAEREQCVNVCEAIRASNAGEYAYITSMAYRKCAEAIRARGQE